MQRGQRADAGEGRGQRVADRDADARRRRDRVADDVAQAAHRLADRAEAGAARVGPGLPVAGDADHDEARVGGGELLPAEVPFLERARAEILDQEVGLRGELEQEPLPLGLAQVERDRFLVARDDRPPERRARPAFCRPQSRIGSPCPGGSILMTSAPMSPSSWPQNGPASRVPSSSTRRSPRGPCSNPADSMPCVYNSAQSTVNRPPSGSPLAGCRVYNLAIMTPVAHHRDRRGRAPRRPAERAREPAARGQARVHRARSSAPASGASKSRAS